MLVGMEAGVATGADGFKTGNAVVVAFAFELPSESLIRHLKDKGILYEDSGTLGFGAEGEKHYGRRHFMELLSVFSAPAMLTALHGMRELGLVEAGALSVSQDGLPTCIALGGHSWIVRQVDWRARRVFVEPTSEGGKGAWIGSGQGLSHKLAQSIKTVLISSEASPLWSTRATAAMVRNREEHVYLRQDTHVLVFSLNQGRARWLNFAGGMVNELIASHLARVQGISGQADDLSVTFTEAVDGQKLAETLSNTSAVDVAAGAIFDDDALEALKFSECLSRDVSQQLMRARRVDVETISSILSAKTVVVMM